MHHNYLPIKWCSSFVHNSNVNIDAVNNNLQNKAVANVAKRQLGTAGETVKEVIRISHSDMKSTVYLV